MKLLKWYRKKLSFRVLIFLFLLFIVGMLAMRYQANKVSAYHDFQLILDLRKGYSFQECYDYLLGLGEAGRRFYSNSFFLIDFAYLIIYNAFYFTMLLYLTRAANTKKRYINIILFLPLLSLLFDFSENMLIRELTSTFPNLSPSICCLASMFTILKFVCVYVCVILVFLLIAFLIGKKIISRKFIR